MGVRSTVNSGSDQPDLFGRFRSPAWKVPDPPRRGNALVAAPALSLLIAVMILVLPAMAGPLAAASSAPYHHVAAANSDNRSSSGCARSAGTHAHWTPASGRASFSVLGSAKKCKPSSAGVGAGSAAYSWSQTLLSVPVHSIIGSTGITSINVTWKITANGSQFESVKGHCPTVSMSTTTGNGTERCDAAAEVDLSMGAYLLDTTNGSLYVPRNYWGGNYSFSGIYNDTSCITFSCTNSNGSYTGGANLSGPISVSFWINATLSLLDKYYVVTWVEGFAYAFVDGFARASASAALDLSAHGNQAMLSSVYVK